MKLVFMGTPDFAAVSLRALAAAHEIEAVFCMPSRPAGRGGKVLPPPVKLTAEELSVPVFQPENAAGIEGQLKRFSPDAVCVAAYGHILPPPVLSMFPRRFINLHASLLPAYRGAAPINRAIMAGETQTGLTTMLISEKLDAGDILHSCAVEIGEDENAEELTVRMAERGAGLFLETLRAFADGTAAPQPQNHEKATYAPALTKKDGEIDWAKSAREICNLIRGTVPWPGAFTMVADRTATDRTVDGKVRRVHMLKIIRARVCPGEGMPGEIISRKNALVIAAGQNAVEATVVQAEGKKRLPAADFLRGARLKTGDILGRF